MKSMFSKAPMRLIAIAILLIACFAALGCSALQEAETATQDAKLDRDTLCAFAEAVPSAPGFAEVSEACKTEAEIRDVVAAYACADASKDNNVAAARQVYLIRLSVCRSLQDPAFDGFEDLKSARDACAASKNLRKVAQAYVGGCG